MNAPEMWFDGKPMEVLRCQLCGGEVGLKSAGYTPDPETVVVRCFACSVVEEAETITRGGTERAA